MATGQGRDGRPPIEEIAQALGISKTTVSRALSGKGRVSEETRAKVFAYVGRPGVDSSTPVRRQDPGATHNLSLVIPKHFMQLDLPFLRKCMGGVCTMAAQRGYDLLQQYGVPFVAIGRIENDDIPQADNDQLGAASEMTRVLFQMGARRIAYLGGSGTYTVNADRLRGYLRGLAEFGVSADQSLIRTGIESDEQRTDALEAVLEQHPDCLLCCDDRIAFDLMRELRNRHIRVPEQLRLASLYDSELLAGTTPAVSAVQFDAERLGSTACRMLLDVMAGKDIPLRQVQGYQVILRESTK